MALMQALMKFLKVPQADVEVDFGGRTDRSLVREIFTRNQWALREDMYQDFMQVYLQELAACLPRRAGQVLPGVIPALQWCQQHVDSAMGLLTGNIRDGAFVKLKHFGLDHFFKWGGFGDVQELREDIAKDAWQAAEQHLGCAVDPQRVLIVGDTPADIRCAQAIGAKSLAVLTGFATQAAIASQRPDYILDDLSDLKAFQDIVMAL